MKTKDLLEFVQDNKRLVIFPIIAFTLLSFIYAVFKPNVWDASQALFIRDESFSAFTRGGRFESTDAMQTAQETIYEVSHHPGVLRAALEKVGPTRKRQKDFPTDRQVEDFGRNVYVSAPNGAKFGRTEMIYLTVRDRKRDRAVELTDAVAKSLEYRMRMLRVDRYQSIIEETEKGVELAQTELEVATAKMETLEKKFGRDLAELRVLAANGMGQGNVRQAMGQIDAELRGARANYSQLVSQYQQLKKTLNDPRKLINMPNTVIDNQPALKRLKEGLVDAQLRASRLMGVQSQRHPDVQAAVKAVDRIRNQLHRELQIAVNSLKGEIGQAKARVASLQKQQDSVGNRMGGLASARTRYTNLAAEVSQRSKFLEESRQKLAIARSNKISAATVSLIQPIEQPVPGTRPLGPGKKLIILGGIFAGMMTSAGLIFLLFPHDEPVAEQQGSGRRAADELYPAFGRRSADAPRSTDKRDRRRGSGHERGAERPGVAYNNRRDLDQWAVKDPLKN